MNDAMPPAAALNGIVCLLAAVPLGIVMLSPRVVEGLICKIGLALLILGLLATAALTLLPVPHNFEEQMWIGLWNAGLLTRGGLLLICVGYWWRRCARGHPCLRASDWMVTADVGESER